MSKKTFIARVKGGPGSGDHGHTGRPGRRGGSAGGGKAGGGIETKESLKRYMQSGASMFDPETQLDFVLDNALRDTSRFAHKYTRKGKTTDRKLNTAYEKAGFQDKGVTGHYIIPRKGVFAGIPMAVQGSQTGGGPKDRRWNASPMFPPQKWDKGQSKWVNNNPKGKAVTEGIVMAIPASEI